MKPLFSFILFVATSLSAIAQTAVSFNEIGLNATPFINQYLDFNKDSNDVLSPYMISYEHRFNKLGFRVGLGLFSSDDLHQPDDDNTEPSIRNTTTNFSIRTGAVFYKDITQKFSLKYGLDAFFKYNLDKSVTSTTDLFGAKQIVSISDLSYEVGLSPFVFIQFHLSPHCSLGTELLGRLSYLRETTKEDDSKFPDFSDEQTSKGTRFSIDPPTALFFIFRF